MERLLLLRAIQQVQGGQEAPHVIREADANNLLHLGGMEYVVPRSVEWKGYVHQRIEERQRGDLASARGSR